MDGGRHPVAVHQVREHVAAAAVRRQDDPDRSAALLIRPEVRGHEPERLLDVLVEIELGRVGEEVVDRALRQDGDHPAPARLQLLREPRHGDVLGIVRAGRPSAAPARGEAVKVKEDLHALRGRRKIVGDQDDRPPRRHAARGLGRHRRHLAPLAGVRIVDLLAGVVLAGHLRILGGWSGRVPSRDAFDGDPFDPLRAGRARHVRRAGVPGRRVDAGPAHLALQHGAGEQRRDGAVPISRCSASTRGTGARSGAVAVGRAGDGGASCSRLTVRH